DRLRLLLAAGGKSQEAEEAFQKALSILEGFGAERATTPADRVTLAELHFRRGQLLGNAKRLGQAKAAYCQAIAVQRELAAEFPGEVTYQGELGRYHNWLGLVLQQEGRHQEAEQAHRQAYTIYGKLAAEADASASQWTRRELAWTCLNLGEALE